MHRSQNSITGEATTLARFKGTRYELARTAMSAGQNSHVTYTCRKRVADILPSGKISSSIYIHASRHELLSEWNRQSSALQTDKIWMTNIKQPCYLHK